jgi:hypothetical protein
VKLLLDENISPKVAEKLTLEDGIDACRVRDRGLLAASRIIDVGSKLSRTSFLR